MFYSFSFYCYTSSLVSRVSVNALSPFFSYFDLYRHFSLTLLSPSLFPFLPHFFFLYVFPFSAFFTVYINLYFFFFFPVSLLLLSFSRDLSTFYLYISRSLMPSLPLSLVLWRWFLWSKKNKRLSDWWGSKKA